MDEGHLPANKMVASNIQSRLDPKLGSESYTLKVTQTAVEISYGDSRGLRWAFMTLRELARGADGSPLAEIPCCTIMDRPRFAWRGFMLDESRHFTGKAGVKRLLDAMASVKMNVLHWHLTDEPAWRLEIKQYPKLTDIGSTGSYSDPQAPKAFYTQEDVAEIIAYAAERGIDIIPEIDMPGHATAANRRSEERV
jgi:hexosaminidase